MSFASLTPRSRRILLTIWLAGGLALLGTMATSIIFTTPYRTTWAWISFIAMVAIEDVAAGRLRHLLWGWRLPRITLVAAIIVFRKHPDVAILVALSAAPLASLVMRQVWFTLLGKTASWLVAVAVGAATLVVIGYGDPLHFVAATVVLLVVYGVLDWVLNHVLDVAVGSASGSAARRFVIAVACGGLGAALALGWRTPAVGPLMLRLAEVCVLAVVGLLIGFALGGTPRGFTAAPVSVRRVPVVVFVAGGLLALSTRVPNEASALLAAAALIALGWWTLRRGAYHAACLVLGGLLNEVARVANGGRMPVEIAGLPPDLQSDFANLTQDSSAYVLAGPATRLPWLADRFPIPVFPGVASLGDIVVAIGIVWLAASLTVARPGVTFGVDLTDRTAA